MDGMHTIRSALPLGDYYVLLSFEDGIRLADLSRFVTRGVFARLSEPHEFAKMYVDPELGTIVWPGNLDLDPDVLYELSTTVTEERMRPFTDVARRIAAGG
jgi:hypothetical protein